MEEMEQFADGVGDSRCKQRGHRITNLFCDFDFTSEEFEVVWKGLKSSCFAMSYWPMLDRVKISTFLWLKKLGSDGEGWFVPP
jgi:hypothetical protein